ncbi:cryptochrome/photolyase family protein [Limibacter armeniacum]|uniref:cryptochrome/photolyase family protein n=1 Tax=Limibacter armeniacum TaxID=466084 RepID=UPI002FE69C00
MKSLTLVFPHQLYKEHPAVVKGRQVVLLEDHLYFSQYPFHKQKLVLHRTSMKFYADFLKDSDIRSIYIEANAHEGLESLFEHWKSEGCKEVYYVDTTDYLLERRLERYAGDNRIKLKRFDAPSFLLSREEVTSFLVKDKKRGYLMADFYRDQRKRFDILLTDEGTPEGGKWSFDQENRKKLPADISLPHVYSPRDNKYVKKAKAYVEKYFNSHYGDMDKFSYPVTFDQAKRALDDFIENRIGKFGDYEDAIAKEESVLFHSVLTPMLNTGLLTPDQVLDRTFKLNEKYDIPLNSLEGFVRQIIGWREFMRGIYQLEGNFERKHNHYRFKRKIPEHFWRGETGIEPIDKTIQKVKERGYCHHIERLMILGNFMHLCEFAPDEVYRWFMVFFIDAYDWVMVPNVYGMSQYADGGLITTKPYVSGSNYVLKMSDYSRGEWCDVWDALYWRYIHKHRRSFERNPRMTMIVSLLDKMEKAKLDAHLATAEKYLKNIDRGEKLI